jgi:hypothetical protein
MTRMRLRWLLVAAALAMLTLSVLAASSSAASQCPPCDPPGKNTGKKGSGQGGGGSTSGASDSSTAPETPATPDTTEQKSDVLARPAGAATKDLASDASKAAKRDEALQERTYAVKIMVVVCSAWLFLDLASSDAPLSMADYLFGPFFYRYMCFEALDYIAALTKIIHDPPDSNFMQVALPVAAATPPVSARCSKRVTARACTLIRTADLRYGKALSAAQTAAKGVATSIERFSGASAVDSEDGRILQAAAAKAYAGELAEATTELQAAGAAFAAALRAARVDVRVAVPTRQTLIKRFGSRGISAALPGSLQKSVTLSGALASPRPSTGYSQFQRELAIYEIAALIKGLNTQGAVSTEISGWLLDDLRDAITSTTPDERASALSQYEGDVGEIGEPAASLLAAAGQALG